jgi:hypothetical protein
MTTFIDPGANGSYISENMVKKYKIPTKKKKEAYGTSAFQGAELPNGGIIDTETAAIPLQIGNHREAIILDVTDMEDDILLGRGWTYKHNPSIDWRTEEIKFDNCNCLQVKEKKYEVCSYKQLKRFAQKTKTLLQVALCRRKSEDYDEKYDYIPEGWKPPERITNKVPEAYWDIPEPFGEPKDIQLPQHTPYDLEIQLKEGTHPRFMALRKNTPEELEALQDFISENEPKGLIRKSKSSAGYPILFVPKKNGKLRLCIDYRHLNDITVKDREPLPRIDEMMDRLNGARYFTALDIIGAYYRIRMKEGEEWKTAFRTRYGLYEWRVMPMGLTNAPANWQRYINSKLSHLLDKGVVVYLDDILIYSQTLEEHERLVREVLEILRDNDLYVDLEKSQFHQEEVEYLGHIVGRDGIKMDPKKVAAVTEWPRPQTVTNIQEFTGFCNYYRRFIEGYSKVATPLYDLVKKDAKWDWTEKCEQAFQTLKERITQGPILKVFDPSKPVIVQTDASDYAIGAGLYQVHDGRKHPIAFISQKLSGPELNWTVHDKELYAIVEACKQWRSYLQGHKYPVRVYSDHKNLTWFLSTKELNRRTSRWWEELSSYDLEIIHTPGKENAQADALSRRADHQGKEKMNHAILLQKDDATITINTSVNSLEKRPTWGQQILISYTKDDTAQKILKGEKLDNFTTRNGYIYHKERIYVPHVPTINEIIQEYHDSPLAGHKGWERTMERISRTFWFPQMTKKVRNYVRTCDTCRKTKPSRHKPYGELNPLEPPEQIGEQVTCDWITDLPPSTDHSTGVTYNQILTIVERLTKFTWFIPWKSKWGATEFCQIFMAWIFQQIGCPRIWISDRDRKLDSKFWNTVTTNIGIKARLSTAYHKETDGQSEIMNQIAEQHIRCYVNYQQNNWVKWLPAAQFAHNSAESTTTGLSPHFAMYGKELPAYHGQYEYTGLSEQGLITAKTHKFITDTLKNDIAFQNEKRKQYFNKHRQGKPSLKKGDTVYLSTRNFRAKQGHSKKLNQKNIGPFKILEVRKGDTFKLELPKTMNKVYPVFHISLLEPAPKDIRIQQTETPEFDDDDDQPEYEVNRILGSVYIDGQLHYLVNWKGYSSAEDSWEPATNLNCPAKLKQYHKQNPHELR